MQNKHIQRIVADAPNADVKRCVKGAKDEGIQSFHGDRLPVLVGSAITSPGGEYKRDRYVLDWWKW